jgi:uncharacterized protein (DUF302 family)
MSIYDKDNGITSVLSEHSVQKAIDRLVSLADLKELTIFAHINFQADAEKAGLKMRPAQMLMFGNPKAGTPLILASPSVAIDLPLKVLAWEDEQGRVWLSYNKPEYLKERHGLPDELLKNISVIKELVKTAAGSTE